jgi:hypothetical protein
LWKVQFLKLGHQRLMIQTIRLTSANIPETEVLRTVDDKRGRPSDVEGRQPKPMIDPIALDHRPIWIDEDW